MLFIQGKNLNIEHPNHTRDILIDVNFHINQNSKIGLIGENGSGKTTFLKLLQGQYINFTGDLSQNFKTKTPIATVIQEIKEIDLTLENYLWMNHALFDLRTMIYQDNNSDISEIIQSYEELGGYDYELAIEKLLKQFGFNETELSKKVSDFSGGEKTKISIISAMLKNPELILFDEPVNNLDLESINWFSSYLKNLEKPFIIVSHERNILDLCVETIWELEDSKLATYTGNYSDYKLAKENNLNRLRTQNENIDRQNLKLKQAIAKRKEKSNSFENFKGERSFKKNGGVCQRDVGSGSSSLNVKKMMKSAIALESRQEKLLAEKTIIKKSKNIEILIENNTAKSKSLLVIENLSIDFDYHSLKNINLTVSANDKISISGKNGIGKSSFLKVISGLNNNYSGNYKWNPQAKISYFSQTHDNLNFSKTVMEELSSITDKSETEIRNILAYLDLTEEKIFNKVGDLSLGERAKLILARIIVSNSNVLILDEPTNHLDIKSREALENALLAFQGCIIFVSHDLYLTEKVSNLNLDMEDYLNNKNDI